MPEKLDGLALEPDAFIERRALRGFGDRENLARVFIRNESRRHTREQPAGRRINERGTDEAVGPEAADIVGRRRPAIAGPRLAPVGRRGNADMLVIE